MSVHDTIPVTTTAPTPLTGPAGVDRRDAAAGEDAHQVGASRAGRRSRPRVSVDNAHCELYGVCEQEAPRVFELGVDGRLRYTARPAAEQVARVRQAARCCPMQAITVTEPR